MDGRRVRIEIRHYENMGLQELDVVKKIGSISTSHAAAALFKLLSKGTRITLPEVNMLGYEETVSRINNPREIIAAVLVKVDEDVEGLMLFLFNLEFANTVLDRLMGESFSDFTEFDETSYSVLVETRNIAICSYINAFSQPVGVEVELSVPNAAVNMLRGVLTVSIAEYGYKTDKPMCFNADFVMRGKKLPRWLLMPPDIDSLNGILDRLGAL